MVCWEIMLSKGQEWDWFGDPFFRVQTLLILFVLWPRRPDLSRAADHQSAHQFSHAARPQFPLVLHRHFLRLRRALRQHHHAPRPAAIALRLRCDDLRSRAFAGRDFRRHDALGRRRAARRAASMRAISWPRGLFTIGFGSLLDVAPQSRNQSMASRLAARRAHRRPLHDLCAAQRRRVSSTSQRNCAAPPSVCSPCCATKAAASALPSPRRSRNGAINSTACASAKISIRSIRP